MCNGKIAGCKSSALLVRNQVACACMSVCESESIIHPLVRVNSERWGWISFEANDWALFLRSRHQCTNEQLGGEIPSEEEALSHQSSSFVYSSPWEYWRRGSGRGWTEMVSCSRLIMASRTERWSTDRLRQCDMALQHSFNSFTSLASRSCAGYGGQHWESNGVWYEAD